MHKVLSGIKVLEQGTFITGPAAGMFLADLGAEVIKIEQPGAGDPFRAFRGGLYSPHFQTYNRNKRSITLNPKLPEDAAVFDELIKDADVYIQNFRPGAADRLGAGEARLRGLNPRLVYCAISGFGQTGPAAGRPAYDTVAQAASAFLKLLVNPANPRVVGPALADAMTGFYAAYGVLGAIVERGRTGVGRKVEVSMLEAMCHFNLDAFTHYFSEDEVMGPYSRPSVSQSYVLECADGLWIALHMSSPEKFWQGLANAIERPRLFDDPRFASREARITNQEDLIALLGGLFREQTRSTWCERLEAEDVPHAPMYDTREAMEDPQARHLQLEVSAPPPRRRPVAHHPLARELRWRARPGSHGAPHAGGRQRSHRRADTPAARASALTRKPPPKTRRQDPMTPSNENELTQAVLQRLDGASDPRFAQIMESLVTHLHAFIREVDLKPDEWMQGIEFLTAVGKACTGQRQEFILLSDTLGASMMVVMLDQLRATAHAKGSQRMTEATEATVQGPYYWEGAPELPLGANPSEGVKGEPTFTAAA